MTCVTADGAFDPATLAFTADASVDGCYPLMLPVNFVFHHSFEDNKGLCFRDLENQSNFGQKLPAVEFVKWIFESAQATESILTYMGAVPLTHATGDAKHIAAVLRVTDTINCGHEPNPVVLPLPVIIGASVAGMLLLVACVGLAYWTVQERNEMKQNPLRGLNVAKEIEGVLEDVRPISEGKVATYIPELGHVDPRLFSIVIVDVKGKVYKCGNWGHKYSIQSMSKPFSYAFAIRERGEEHMKQCVGVEPAGGAFDAIEMDPHGRPFNPYINSGALAVAMQLRGDKHERYSSWAEFLGSYCGSRLELDKGIYESESSTAARNREIAEKLIETGVCKNQYDKASERDPVISVGPGPSSRRYLCMSSISLFPSASVRICPCPSTPQFHCCSVSAPVCLSLYLFTSLSVGLFLYRLALSLSLSLSLSRSHTHTHTHTHTHRSARHEIQLSDRMTPTAAFG